MIDFIELKEGYSKMEVQKENKYATRKQVAIATAVPVATSIGLAAHNYFSKPEIVEEPINVLAQAPIPEPSTVVEAYTPLVVNAPVAQPTGYIADKSLEMLATILDPVIDILVAISFPIASVIMVGACFFFMIGNSERAWSMIMNAGLGYVLIQLSPLFLEILRTVGEAVGN